MARYRKKSARTKRKFSFKSGKIRRKSSDGGNLTGLVIGAAVYGAAREYTSNMLEPVIRPVAGIAGSYADELVLGSLGYALAKGKIPMLGKYPIVRNIGRAALTIEAARVGATATAGMMPSSAPTISTNPIYGGL